LAERLRKGIRRSLSIKRVNPEFTKFLSVPSIISKIQYAALKLHVTRKKGLRFHGQRRKTRIIVFGPQHKAPKTCKLLRLRSETRRGRTKDRMRQKTAVPKKPGF